MSKQAKLTKQTKQTKKANSYPTFTISDTKKSNDWLKHLPCLISKNGEKVALVIDPKDIRWIDNISKGKTYVSHGTETHELGDQCLTCDRISKEFEEAKKSGEIAELLEKGPDIYDDPNYVPPKERPDEVYSHENVTDTIKDVQPVDTPLRDRLSDDVIRKVSPDAVKTLSREDVDAEASKMAGEENLDTLEQRLDPNTKYVVHGDDRHSESESCEICDKAVLEAKTKAEEEVLEQTPEASKHDTATSAQAEALRLATENKGRMTGVVERNVPMPSGPPVHGYKDVADIEKFTNEQAKRNKQTQYKPAPPRKADYVDLEMV